MTGDLGGHLRGLLATPELVGAGAVEPRLAISSSAAGPVAAMPRVW